MSSEESIDELVEESSHAIILVSSLAQEHALYTENARERGLPYTLVIDAVSRFTQAADCFRNDYSAEGVELLREAVLSARDFWRLLPVFPYKNFEEKFTVPRFEELPSALETVLGKSPSLSLEPFVDEAQSDANWLASHPSVLKQQELLKYGSPMIH